MAQAAERKKKEPSFLAKGYLLAYNGLLTLGWAYLLVRAIQYTVEYRRADGLVPGLYRDIRMSLLIFQTAALLEVVHSAVGIVSSSVVTTLMQVSSRVFITWPILEWTPGVDDNIGLLLISYAWAITEVIRYSFYFFSLLNSVPYLIKWCRYTFFYVLYPVGVLGEMMLYFAALPVIKARDQWSCHMPNSANMAFNFYYFLVFTMLMYIPLFPQLYGHMISQRRKIIEGAGKPKTD